MCDDDDVDDAALSRAFAFFFPFASQKYVIQKRVLGIMQIALAR